MLKLQYIHRLVVVGAFGIAVALSAGAAQRPEGGIPANVTTM